MALDSTAALLPKPPGMVVNALVKLEEKGSARKEDIQWEKAK